MSKELVDVLAGSVTALTAEIPRLLVRAVLHDLPSRHGDVIHGSDGTKVGFTCFIVPLHMTARVEALVDELMGRPADEQVNTTFDFREPRDEQEQDRG